jgi:hypothetical protein
MKLNLIYANNPKWVDEAHTSINLTVRFEEIDEDLPFHATPYDVEEHGRDIFTKAIAGEFGVIAEWTPPTTEQLATNARGHRDNLLSELDSIVGNPLRWASFSTEQQTSWANYRQALLDVPQQDDFPNIITWPTKPEGSS